MQIYQEHFCNLKLTSLWIFLTEFLTFISSTPQKSSAVFFINTKASNQSLPTIKHSPRIKSHLLISAQLCYEHFALESNEYFTLSFSLQSLVLRKSDSIVSFLCSLFLCVSGELVCSTNSIPVLKCVFCGMNAFVFCY